MPLYLPQTFLNCRPLCIDLLIISVQLVCTNKLILRANALIPAKNQHAKVRTEPFPPTKIFLFVFSFITTLQKFQTYSTEALDVTALIAPKTQHASNMIENVLTYKVIFNHFFFLSWKQNKVNSKIT